MSSDGADRPGGSEATGVIRSCISCGRSIDFSTNVCPYCGYDYRVPVVAGPPPVRKSATPVAGGILVLIAGVLALINAATFMTYSAADLEGSGVELPEGTSWDDVLGILRVCGAIEVVFGAVAILGGVFAVKRTHFGLAVAGSIMGMLGFGMALGSVLGLIGLILVAVSRKEFH